MIRDIKLKNYEIKRGKPGICIPISGSSLEEVLWEIEGTAELPCDLIEWRTDCFREDVVSVLRSVCSAVGDKPLLITLRTKSEGGKADISDTEYEERLTKLIKSQRVDMVDIELSKGDELVERLVKLAKENNVAAIVSAHNFEATWSYEEICSKLEKMEEIGADIPKIACMPQSFGDVLTLMKASYDVSEKNYPIITMSMGREGKVSRISGEYTGSVFTFGCAKIASAPGQIKAGFLKEIVEELDK